MNDSISQKYVVCVEGSSSMVEGHIIGPAEASALVRQGGVVMPCDTPDSPYSGNLYIKYYWGRSQSMSDIPKMHCPMQLFLRKTLLSLHWTVALEPLEYTPGMRGSFQLIDDTRQGAIVAGNIAHSTRLDLEVEFAKESPRSDKGTYWILQGKSRLVMNRDGNISICVYGYGKNVFVRWISFSQSI